MKYAFPVHEMNSTRQRGMTLEDYFASQAIIGLLSYYGNHEDHTKAAYEIATLMITRRTKETE